VNDEVVGWGQTDSDYGASRPDCQGCSLRCLSGSPWPALDDAKSKSVVAHPPGKMSLGLEDIPFSWLQPAGRMLCWPRGSSHECRVKRRDPLHERCHLVGPLVVGLFDVAPAAAPKSRASRTPPTGSATSGAGRWPGRATSTCSACLASAAGRSPMRNRRPSLSGFDQAESRMHAQNRTWR
jgi:hypothetical protein